MDSARNNGTRLRFGQFEADLSEGKLFHRGLPVRIEKQPFQILAALLEHPGEVVGREELRNRLWTEDTHVDFDEGVNTAVKKLRYSLRDSAKTPVFIETVPRQGYRFLVPISSVAPAAEEQAKAGTSASLQASMDQTGSIYLPQPNATNRSSIQSHRAGRGSRMHLAGLFASLLLVVVGLSAYGWRTYRSQLLPPEGMEIRKLSGTGNVDAVAISHDGRYVIYARRTGEIVSLRMRQIESGGDVEVLPGANVAFMGLTFSPDGNFLYYVRSNENDTGYRDLYVMPALGGPSRKLVSNIDSPVSFAPDGGQFVFTRGFPASNQIEVRIANSDGTSEHLLATIPQVAAGYQPGATWSPVGEMITVPVSQTGPKTGSTLLAISLANGNQQVVYSSEGTIGRPLWRPDGRTLLVTLREPHTQGGQLWSLSVPSGKRDRITNDVGDYDITTDMTSDGREAATVVTNVVSDIWASSPTDLSHFKQITKEGAGMFDVIETEDGKLLTKSPGELWTMDADGNSRASFAKLFAAHIRTCGLYVVAVAWENGSQYIVRLNRDGTHAVTLVAGSVLSPDCSPDGKFVFYADVSQPQRILKVPIEGGTPIQVARIPGDGLIGSLELSHDGKSLLFIWERYLPAPSMHFSILSSGNGELIKTSTAPPGINGRLRWSLNDNSLEYVLTRNEADNLWQQDIFRGSPKQLTNFKSGIIFSFNRARSDNRLLIARGSVTKDSVILSHLH